ncbi:MAG: hypothetical protein V2I33_24010, partial [Kangiellaceae bacterium]|nr:hypothetical protein [Kangiellaceae bacterium]
MTPRQVADALCKFRESDPKRPCNPKNASDVSRLKKLTANMRVILEWLERSSITFAHLIERPRLVREMMERDINDKTYTMDTIRRKVQEVFQT